MTAKAKAKKSPPQQERYLDIGVGTLDLAEVQTSYCEPRRRTRWSRRRPAMIVYYKYDPGGECEFLFDDEFSRDEAHQKLWLALNAYANTTCVRRINTMNAKEEAERPAVISLARAAELFGVDDPPFTAGPWEASGANGVHKGIRAIAITHGDDRTANARAIASLPILYQALEVINVLACYTQENQNARDEMLLNIGSIAREATATLNATAHGGTTTVDKNGPAS